MNEATNNYIFEVDEKNIVENVIEKSTNLPVLVDFWAPWCGPCKQLTPVLEKITTKAKGGFLLAKINIDENKQIAAQLNIQSIPTVMIFKDKKIVDAFQGVIPENKIIEFVEKHLNEKLEKDFSEFYESVEKLFFEKKYNEAKDLIENHLAENSEDIKTISLYIDCLVGLNLFDESESFLESLDKKIIQNDVVNASIQKLNIKRNNSGGTSLNELQKTYEKNPNKIDNLVKLSEKLFSEDRVDEAFDLLLLNFSKNKDVKKNKMVEFFEALGNNNEKTIYYRKKLSSIIFS